MTQTKPKLPKLTREQRIGSAVIPGLTDPDALAVYKVKAYGRSLAPDDPLYGVTVENLSQMALHNPEINPDDALAMITGGVPQDSQIGTELARMRQELAAVEERNKIVAQENYLQEQSDEESWFQTAAKGVSRFAFAVMSTPKEILDNNFRTMLKYADGNNEGDHFQSFIETFTNTTTSKMAEGFFEHWFDTSDIDPMYDFGSSWFPEYNTAGGENLKRLHEKQYMGTEFGDLGKQVWDPNLKGEGKGGYRPEKTVWDPEANDGKGALVQQFGGASPGQIIAERFLHVDATSPAFGALSGTVDALSYLADPSIFVPLGTTAKLASRITRKSLGGAEDLAIVADAAKAASPAHQIDATFGDVARKWDEYTEAEKKAWLSEHSDPDALESQLELLDQKQKLLDDGEIEALRLEVLGSRLAPDHDRARKAKRAVEVGERDRMAVDQALASRAPDIDELEERMTVLAAQATEVVDEADAAGELSSLAKGADEAAEPAPAVADDAAEQVDAPQPVPDVRLEAAAKEMERLRAMRDKLADPSRYDDAEKFGREMTDELSDLSNRADEADPFDLTPEDIERLNTMRVSDGTPVGDLMKDVADLQVTIAGLKRARDAMDEALAPTYQKRDEAWTAYEAAARSERKRLDAMGDGPADDVEWLKTLVGHYGDTFSAGSQGRFHLDRAIRFVSGAKAAPLVKYLAKVDDDVLIWNLTRGKWPPELVRAIAKTDSEDEIRDLMAGAIADGGLHTGTIKARTLNAAARGALGGRDPNTLVSPYVKAWGVAARAMNYGLNRKVSNVPWAHAYNTENLDDMVSGISDMVSFVYRFNPFASVMDVVKGKMGRGKDSGWFHARERHDELVGRMLKTETAAERRRVYYEVVSELTREMGRKAGLNNETQEQFETVMKASRARAEGAISTLAESRAKASGQIELMGVDPEAWKNMNPAVLESELQFSVLSPDWHKMQRAMKSANEVIRAYGGQASKSQQVKRIVDDLNDKLFERYWRTAVLAFRGGYVLRNIADMQVRMYLSGHPSMFTNPLGIIALATANRTNNKLMKQLQRANLETRYDKDGNLIELTREQDEEIFGQVVDGFRSLSARQSSMADPVVAEARRVKHAGWEEVKAGDGRFADFLRGWVNELQIMGASPMAREVLRIKYGRVSPHIKRWAERRNQNLEDAVVDYFWDGPGRADSLDPMIQSSVPFAELFTGKGLQRAGAPEGEMIQGKEALRALFWGGGSANYAERWARVTNDGDSRILDLLLEPREPKRGKGPRDVGGEPLLKTAEGMIDPDEELLKQLRSLSDVHGWDTPEGRAAMPVQAVRAPKYEDVQGGGLARGVESAVDAFFHIANVTEKQLGYLPEFRAAKWDAAANYIRALSPEDAQKLVAIAEASLGSGKINKGTSWVGAGASHFGPWRKRTLAKLRREAKQAKGSGAFTLDDMKHVTDRVGVDEIKRNFYDAQKRNQFGYSMRYIIPFGQAFANTLETWTRLAFQNPGRVYAATVLYRAGTGKDSNWLMDDPSNPEDSWIFTDSNSGQSMIGIPVLGQTMTRLANLLPGPDVAEGAFQMHTPVQSGNLIFQNGLMPGFGPMIQIPAQMLESTEAYQNRVPDIIKRSFVPYVNVDPDRDRNLLEMFTPGWVSAMASGLGVPGYDNGIKKHIGPAMATIYSQNPEAFPHNSAGMLTEDGQRLLLEQATAVAHRLEFWRGAFMNLAPSALMGDFLVQTDDPAVLGSQAIMTVEYQEKMRENGNREEALMSMADKYGARAMVALMSDNKYNITPTGDAYAAVKEHPELANQHASVFSILYPGGGYSPYMDRWNRIGYGNIKLTNDEKLDTANQLLSTLAQARLDKKLTDGIITQEEYDLQYETLQNDLVGYPTPDTDTRGRDNTIKSLRDAVADPTLGATPAGTAIREYLDARDYALEKGGWGGESKAQLRTQMRLIGEGIAERIPEFRVAWLRLFRAEIMQSEESDADVQLKTEVQAGKDPVTLDELRSVASRMNDNMRGKARSQDGDTLEMPDGSYVRLVGVDTVEKGEPGYGRSGRFTQRFVNRGDVQLENPPGVDDYDPYNRLIRYVLVNNRDLGLALIRRGIARPFYDSESDIEGHTYDAHPKQSQYHAAFEKNNEQWLGSYRDGE